MKLKIALLIGILLLHPEISRAEYKAADVDKTLSAIEEGMSGVKSIETDFVQEKSLSLFKQKLILRGKVFIQKPGLLSWRAFSPMRYSMVISAGKISQWDEDTDKVQSISLADNPGLQAEISQMQSWLSGTYKPMQQDYIITLVSEKPAILEFSPKANSAAGNFIKRVAVEFQDDLRYLKEINIEESNSDKTSLKFMNTKLNQPIDLRAWEAKEGAH
jgi:outer membrane lipoprotein-sorting protein